MVFLQNHDQVGNRASGERLNVLLELGGQAAAGGQSAAALAVLPLLFMGEEYGEENPFPFFCSFRRPELIEAVRDGPKAAVRRPSTGRARCPTPAAEATFASAKLSWSWPEGTFRAGLRRLYRDLLAARREWPALRDFENRIGAARPERKAPASMLELVRGDDAGRSRCERSSTSATGRSGSRSSPARHAVLFSSESRRVRR